MGLDNCFGSFKLRVMFRTLFCYCLLISSLCGTVCCNYLNQFAVHVTGDPVESVRRADQIAAKHGFKNLGQVWEGDNYFLFEHHHIAKRSTNPSHHHHSLLSEDPEVRWFQQQYVKKRVKRDYIPVKLNDRLWRQQWYLNGGGHRGDDTHETFDMSVKGAWDMGYSGKGIVVTILDDGIERTHDDLKDNYDPQASYDVNGDDNDPMPKYDPTNENRHGTRCAGEVAAKANNSKCIVGAAFNARIGGVRMLDGEVSDVVEAKSLGYNRDHIDIYSASWGPDDDGKVVDGPGPLARKAFTDGIAKGRGGKGSVFVWASGNGGSAFDSCNCDGYTNSIYTLSISSTSEHGHKPWYLEECSSTLATTYSSGRFDEKQIVTTDLRNKCTTSHTGTSASAPLAAGLVALVLEANPSLTWRDVQYITLLAANPKPMADGEWITNGKNRQVSLRYGYGLMNATAMVEYALKWKNVPAKHICRVSTGVSDVKLMGTRYESKIHTDGCSRTGNEVKYLEHVQAQITLSYYRRGNLVIHLTSPSGTRSTLLPKRPSDMSRGGFNNWAFLSVHFWEEDPSGTWKLEIEDNHSETSWPKPPPSGARGTLKSWTLILHGTKTAPIDIKNEPYTKPATTTQKTTHVGSITTMTSNCHAECVSSCSGPGPEHCIGCKHLRMGEHGACVTACPNGHRKSKNMCLPCDGSCELCTTHLDKAHCDKCKDGYFMLEGEGTCTVECPDGYYLGNSALKTCKKCNRECELCAERADKCTKCPSRMILQLNKCYLPQKMCDIGFYKDSRQNCQRCAWGCDFCDGPGRCVQCAKYSYMLNGACMRKCPKGYLAYVVKLAQSTVHNECRQCLTASCDSCSSHFALKNGQCEQIKSCQKTQYFDFTIMECKDCHWKCSSCRGPGSHQCLNCNSPLAYHSYLHTCLPCCHSGQKQTTCCNCNLNEGVCMLKPMEESQTNPKAVLVLVLVGITALLIVTVVTLIIKLVLYKKLVPSKELSYQKLRQQDDDKDFDGLIQDNI